MGRSILAEASLEGYLEKLSKLEKISIGLIIGQPGKEQGKDFIIHLARTTEDLSTDETNTHKPSEAVIDLDSNLVSNHSLSVIRMLPANFSILGVFIVSPTNLFDDINAFQKVKIILFDIRSLLRTNDLLIGTPDINSTDEMLVLHYSSTSRSSICKSVELNDSSRMLAKPADWKFQDKTTTWTMIETYYELDEIFPLIKKNEKINLEDNFRISLDVISKQIKNSIVFFDGEGSLEGSETLEYVLKKSNNKNDNKSMQATIYFPCTNDNETVKIQKYNGTVRYNGIVSSRVWANSKNTIHDIENYIKSDIIRSLASRIQIHCDGLLPTDIVDEIIMNEPPRRIFFPIKSSQVQFSDYIFRDEGDETVIRQAKELLDIDLQKIDIISDVETLPEIEENIIKKNDNTSAAETSKFMYFLGILAAIIVLVISIILHFMFK